MNVSRFPLAAGVLACVVPIVASGCTAKSSPAAPASHQPTSSTSTSTSKKQHERLPDDRIEEAVASEIDRDLGRSADNIVVTSTDGIVELTGLVPHLLASERAALLAESIRGVRSVDNMLQVRPNWRPDAAIASDIERALLLDPATESFDIGVRVEQGIAKLDGKVQSWTERKFAERVAKAIKGVRAVRNDIDVRYRERDPYGILEDVRARLEWDPFVHPDHIDVDVAGSTVRLSGEVGSAAEKRRALDDAWVGGVRSVDDSGLAVAWWLKDRRQRSQPYESRDEGEISDAIQEALLIDPRLSATNIRPTVKGSHVTLEGHVDNLRAEQAAQHIAEHTAGVLSVTNDLKIEPTTRMTDAEVQGNIEWWLWVNPITESREIGIEVDDGWVTLFGNVDTFAERAEVEDIALRTRGVRGLTDELQAPEDSQAFVYDPWLDPFRPYVLEWASVIPAKPSASDRDLKREIQHEIDWNALIDKGDISVSVVNGVATLSGRVHSHLEHEAAVSQAYEGGAIKVVDRLATGS